jgi:hypothetical protein
MAIKPIDLQIMMPRVNEMSRIQNDELQRNHAAQQSAVQSTDKQSENNLKQVTSREETQKTAIREKQEGRKQSSGQGKESEEDDEQDKKQNPDKQKLSGRTIDIRL